MSRIVEPRQPPDPDEVRVVIEGTELAGWEGVTIGMAIDHIADAFSVSAPWDPDRKDLRRLLRPFGYQPAQVYIGKDLYLTGRVDLVTPSLEAGERRIVIQGRSLTGQLADCSVEADAEYSGLMLSIICRQVCRPFGLSVRADYDVQVGEEAPPPDPDAESAETTKVPETRAQYGQKAADFLNSIAAPRNFLLNASYKGELVITDGSALVNKTPVARLVEGEHPLLSVGAAYDGSKRYSRYGVASQFAGMTDITGAVTDPDVVLYRPYLQVAGETDTVDPALTASRLRTQALSEAIGIAVLVTGWRRPDGARWAERQALTLLAPSAMLYTEAKWIIAEAKFRLDVSGGRTTEMRLVPPDLYLRQKSPKKRTMPWA